MASDGSRLNLAATLAETAAGLQKQISARGRASDPVMAEALVEVQAAVRSLAAAVAVLAAKVEGDG